MSMAYAHVQKTTIADIVTRANAGDLDMTYVHAPCYVAQPMLYRGLHES